MEKSDLWNVQPEKPKRADNIEKIDDKYIISVNQPVKKIEIKKRPYFDLNQPKVPSKINEDDIQTSFNSNIVINEPRIVPLEKPKGHHFKKKSRVGKPNINSFSPKPSPARLKNLSDLKFQPRSPEIDSKIASFCEIFELIPKSTVEKIVKENFLLPEDQLYEKLFKLNIPQKVEKNRMNSSLNIRNTEKPINLKEYKKSLCIDQNHCAKLFCEFYHFEGERRRVVDNYIPKICENKKCDNCEGCECSHTLSEIFYHESIYKKLSCPFQECPLQELCFFSHESKQELSTLADKLNNEFEETLNKLDLAKKKSEKIQNEINQLNEDKKQLRQNLVCCCCNTYRITYIFSSCGHCVCTKCISGYSQTYTCCKCNIQTRYIEINYNYNKN